MPPLLTSTPTGLARQWNRSSSGLPLANFVKCRRPMSFFALVASRLSAVTQNEHGLLNCALFLDEHEFVAPDDPWMAIRGMIQRKGSLIGEGLSVASNAPFVACGLYEYLVATIPCPAN